MQMENNRLNSRTIDDLYDKAEEVYSNICIIKAFCENYYDTEDFYKLRPILNYTEKTSDLLYAELIELKHNN